MTEEKENAFRMKKRQMLLLALVLTALSIAYQILLWNGSVKETIRGNNASTDKSNLVQKAIDFLKETQQLPWGGNVRGKNYFDKMSARIPELEMSSEELYHPYYSLSRSVKEPDMFLKDKVDLPPVDPNGYISYMPNSGFSNQMSELKNALVLAKLLNRTLIVPPLYLGHHSINSWREFPLTQLSLRLVETFNFNRKAYIDSEKFGFIEKFLLSDSMTPLVPWSEIVDLDLIARTFSIKYVNVAEFVGLDLLHEPRDIMQVQDWRRYEYSLVDYLPGGDTSKLFDNQHSNISFTEKFHWDDLGKLDQWFVLNMTPCKTSDQKLALKTVSGFYLLTDKKKRMFKTRYVHESLKQMNDFEYVMYRRKNYQSCDGVTSGDTKPSIWKKGQIFNSGASTIAQIKIDEYRHVMNLKAFENSEQPVLLQFGSLFGNARIKIFNDENANLGPQIGSLLQISNPIILQTMQSIVDIMTKNGTSEFIALHIRLNDGPFELKSNVTIEGMASKIKELLNNNALSPNTPTYIATDVDFDKEKDYSLKPIAALLPKHYSIANFFAQVSKLEDMEKDRLSKLNSAEPNLDWISEMTFLFDQVDQILVKSGIASPPIYTGEEEKVIKHHRYLSKYIQSVQEKASSQDTPFQSSTTNTSTYAEVWIPNLEQLICSRARLVIGTSGSTFSRVIGTHHTSFWSAHSTTHPYGPKFVMV